MLLPEVLIKPSADEASREYDELKKYIASMELWPTTETVGELAVWLGASYGLDPIDAVHLATAVDGGADVFLTNNSRDFDAALIGELDILYPRDIDFV
jgi:predicted nucleic acid-binding protein